MNLDWVKEAKKKNESFHELLSFTEYFDRVERNPTKHIRPSCLYFKDMFDYFGKDDDGGFKLFTTAHVDCPAVFGQNQVQTEIYKNLLNFLEEGFNNKFLLLVGPNGSSKSSLIKKIMKGAEIYSEVEEGAIYTFSWIFPINSYIKGSLGLPGNTNTHDLSSYAHLDDKDISAILNSELKDHPLLLIPVEYRQEFIDNFIGKDHASYETIVKSYLYQGDVSKRNRMIYDALLKSYKGDHAEVLKHIRIERFNISRRYSSSAVTIEPQMHVDANMQQITMDKRLANLPPSLQSLNLYTMNGEAIQANRGILEFSDLLKRPLDTFKYLLMTMETQNVNLRGILVQLDILFIGSSNEIHLVAFKQHPDFNSFKGRLNFLRVPYLLDAKQEAYIYTEQIDKIKNKTTYEPHAIETLALFAVMTRIRPPQEKNYKDKTLGKITATLSPLEKSLLYAGTSIPDRFDSEQKQILKLSVDQVLKEFENENLYEGKFGVSPRVIKQMIYDIASTGKHITFLHVLDYLSSFVEKKNEYDFLNIPPQGEYNNCVKFIEALKNYQFIQFDLEVRNSLGLVDDRSYEDYIAKYIQNINALIKGEKIKNTVTGQFEAPNQYAIEEFEKSINLKEKPEDFRYHLLSSLGAYSLDNPGKSIIYTQVFPDLLEKLQASFRQEQKKLITKVSKNILFWLKEREDEEKKKLDTSLSKENRQQINSIVQNLKKKMGYSEEAVITLLQQLIIERY